MGIGASAGGLEALEIFFRQMPPETGMAFVVVSHQSPGHVSLLPELLAKCTEMKPVLAAQGSKIEPNCIYVNPPGHDLAIIGGEFQLIESRPRGIGHLPIDYFLRSLASERKELAICIILSGSGTDGTVGLRAIKAESGLVIVQEPGSAKFAGMPSSGIATRLVDYVLRPEDMAAALTAYAERLQQGYLQPAGTVDLVPTELLDEILTLLRQNSGHDFALYKRNMIQRRVSRRMMVNHTASPQEYIRFLESHSHEVSLLLKELLISVTSFFRDPEAFEILAHSALPEFVSNKPEGTPLRAWVPGCATGEEAYSLGILLAEVMEETKKHFDVQIFGTDLDRSAIDVARRGYYPAGISIDVSPQRLERFYLLESDHYRVRKEIREKIIFAIQDLIKDPPFTKLDIIFCRNVLIYMDNTLQGRVLPMFHYALNPGGVLFLGSCEALSGFDDMFQVVDKKWKIFLRKEGLASYSPPSYPFVAVSPEIKRNEHPRLTDWRRETDISALAERLLASRYAPTSAIVNEHGDIFFIHGKAGAYLEPAAGKQPNNNLLNMAREGLSLPLASVLRRTASETGEVLQENVRVRTNGYYSLVTIVAAKISEPEPLRGLIMVTFQPVTRNIQDSEAATPPVGQNIPVSPDKVVGPDKSDPMLEVERELLYTRESLQSTIEELQTSNEELQSANEELQSSNEELETAREEMQSLNEELQTVNRELEAKIEQLSLAKDDMQNLLDGIDIATIFLDARLRIRRFTRSVKDLIKILETDIGRPLSDLASNLNYSDLIDDAETVLRTLAPRELELQTKDGEWRLMRIAPYRTIENAIEGLVITFVNITRLKRAEERANVTSVP